MRSLGINGEEELRRQPANPGSPGNMAIKMVCVCVCVCMRACMHAHESLTRFCCQMQHVTSLSNNYLTRQFT